MPLLLGTVLSMAGGVVLAFLLIGAPLPTVGVLLLGLAGYVGWRLWRPCPTVEPIRNVVRTDHSSQG